MKKFIYTFSLILIGFVAVQAQEASFESLELDYGEIAKGADGHGVFTFTNSGEKPLIIKSVRPSCGCTVAEYPKEPIMPGSSAEIKVGYNTNIVGPFSRTIEVYSNSDNGARKILRVKGNVLAE